MHTTLLWVALMAAPTPLRLPAEVEDVYALEFNPAGLGYVRGAELRLLYGRDATGADLLGQAIDGFGAYGAAELVDGLVLGAGFQVDTQGDFDKAQHRQVFGLAYGGSRASFGFSYANVAPFGRDNKGVFSVGFTYRVARWLSTALAVTDVAQNLDRRQWDLGLALRPLGERITLSTRWRLRQSQPLNADTLDLTFLLSAEPFDGLTLGVAGNVDLDFTFMLAIDLEHFGTSATVVRTDEADVSVGAELVYRSSRKPPVVNPAKIAVVTLAGALVPPPKLSLLSQSVDTVAYGGAPLALDALSRSDRVDGLFVRIGPLSIGWAKAQEIREGLLKVSSTGRRVDCYLSGAGDIEYFVATACETIAVAPPMNLRVNGVAAEVMYFAETLDQIGVEVDVVRRGKFKNSPDQFTRSGMSVEQREALTAYIDTVFDTLVTGIERSRKIPRAEVERFIDLGTVTATEAVKLRLVDHVLYPDELDAHLERLHGRALAPAFGAKALDPTRRRWTTGDRIAVIHVDAEITGGSSRDLPFGLGKSVGARTLVRALEKARTDDGIVAVVLRVDSPGGDSFASDLIARAVQRVQEVKPVVASFGDIAASGGYYVAAGAGTIMAEPTTLTGSIGVYAMLVSAEGLFSKLGIKTSFVERGLLSSAPSLSRPLSPAGRRALGKTVDDAYRLFVDTVARGRRMKAADVRAVAEGRIWSGKEAKARGLVDELGGLVAAVRRAKKEAGLNPDEPIRVQHLPGTRTSLSGLVGLAARAIAPEPREQWSVAFPHATKLSLGRIVRSSFDPAEQPKALVPYVLDVR